MKLTVLPFKDCHLKDSHFEITVQPIDSIMAVKKNIEDVQGKDIYPCGQQFLFHNGKFLKDETTLAENEVTQDGVLVLSVTKSKSSGSAGASSAQPASTTPATSAPTPPPKAPVQAPASKSITSATATATANLGEMFSQDENEKVKAFIQKEKVKVTKILEDAFEKACNETDLFRIGNCHQNVMDTFVPFINKKAQLHSNKDAELALTEKEMASKITDLDSKADELIKYFRAEDNASCRQVLRSLMNEVEFYCRAQIRVMIGVKLNELGCSLLRQVNPGARNAVSEGPLIPRIDAATSFVANKQPAEFQSEKHAAIREWKSTKRSNCDGSPLKPCKREKLCD